jgi:hypothetical protein
MGFVTIVAPPLESFRTAAQELLMFVQSCIWFGILGWRCVPSLAKAHGTHGLRRYCYVLGKL